ncbi:MAG TPA: hypothetical protein VIB39_10885 [Candidatus Angelobacter sp.]
MISKSETQLLDSHKSIQFPAYFTLVLLALLLLAGCNGAFAPLTEVAPDFTMSASPGSQTVVAGRAASIILALNPPDVAAFGNFSVSGLPPGAQASFVDGFPPNSGTKALNISTSINTPPGNSQLTISVSDNGRVHSATVNLTITPAADFTMSVTPSVQSVKPGASANYTVNVTFTGNATNTVNLSATGLPFGATAAFDHNSLTASGTAVLTVTAGPDLTTSFTHMHVVASDSAGTISAPFEFDIVPADFALDTSIDGPVEMNAGGTITATVGVSGLQGTPGAVNLSASGVPPGMTVTFNPAVVTGVGVSTVTIATDGSILPNGYIFNIDGVDASGTNRTRIQTIIVPGNPAAGFFLSAAPINQFVIAGQGALFNININAPGGTIPPLTFTVTTDHAGVTGAVFKPAGTGPGFYQVGVSTDADLLDETATITVTATGPNGSQSIDVNVAISSAPTS